MKRFKIPRKDLKSLYHKNKLSISKIAKVYGCSYITIWKRMKEYNIKTRTYSEANTLNNLARKINIPKDKLKELYIKKRLPTTKIAKKYNCYHQTILKRMKEYGIKSRSKSEAMIIYPKKDFSNNSLEKSYLIGFRLGDLYVKKLSKNGKVIAIECSSTIPQQIKLIKNLFKNYGHFNQYFFKGPEGRKEIRIKFNLNDSFNFLLEKKDEIPNWILKKNNYFFSFLAGYTDAEGHIGIHLRGGTKQACFNLGSYDKNILKQIWIKLNQLNLNPKLRIGAKKGHISKSRKVPYKKDFWCLNIHSKKQLLQLFNKISPHLKHENKIKNLNKAIQNINYRNNKFGNLRM